MLTVGDRVGDYISYDDNEYVVIELAIAIMIYHSSNDTSHIFFLFIIYYTAFAK